MDIEQIQELVTGTEEVVNTPRYDVEKFKKLSPSKKIFVNSMIHVFKEQEFFDVAVDESGHFVNQALQRDFDIYSAGKRQQSRYEPGVSILAKLLPDGSIQVSDRPQAMYNGNHKKQAAKNMSKRHGGFFFFLTIDTVARTVIQERAGDKDKKLSEFVFRAVNHKENKK